MQLQEVAEPFGMALSERAELSRLILDRFTKGEPLDFLDEDPEDEEEAATPEAERAEPSKSAAEAAADRRTELAQDVRLLKAVRGISELTLLATTLLRRDMAFASADPAGDHRKLIAEMTQRIALLGALIALRPAALRRQPRLAHFWTEDHVETARHTIDSTKKMIALIQTGKMRRRPESEILREFIAVLPVVFGAPAQTPDAVVRFCEDEGISYYLLLAAKAVKQSFPKARDPVFEVIDDPEGEGAWVTIRVAVPKKDSLAHYKRYVSEVVRLIPSDELGKIRLAYIPH